MRAIRLDLPAPLLHAYAGACLALSLVLLSFSLQRGATEATGWLLAWLCVVAVGVRAHETVLPAAGGAALLLGFVRTRGHGADLDLGLSLVALAVALSMRRLPRREDGSFRIDPAGLGLLAVAGWSLLSLGFTVVRLRSFSPAPGFAYRAYQVNATALSSDEALVRTVIGATVSLCWFGLYQCAAHLPLRRERLRGIVAVVVASNAAALLVQSHLDPGFLIPSGWPVGDRLNGLTSFCYALADASLALFLLLPAWAERRGKGLVLTVAIGLLLVHAAFLSGSRTALFGMALALLLWAVTSGTASAQTSRRWRGLALTGAAVLAAGLGLAYHLAPSDHRTPLGRLKESVRQGGLVRAVVDERLSIYPLAFRVMREHALAGLGAGMHLAEIGKQRDLLMPELQVGEAMLLSSFAPNQFLNTGVELGLPALAALILVFIHAAHRGLAGRPPRAPLIGLLVLLLALQFGPSLHNSEALVFVWMIVGLCARSGVEAAEPPNPRRIGAVGTSVSLVALLVLGLVGQAAGRRRLDMETQWQHLRWRLGMGMLPAQPEGRWTRPEATFSIDTSAKAVSIVWHAGDASAPDYLADVAFFVDGELRERSPSRSGVLRETLLQLPAAPGYKRISIRVCPPFEPEAFGVADERRLGIFIHAVKPH